MFAAQSCKFAKGVHAQSARLVCTPEPSVVYVLLDVATFVLDSSSEKVPTAEP